MKLYLDDCRPCPEGFTLVLTVEEAIAWIKRAQVTHISFDHDLGDSYPDLTTAKTGNDLAKWIEEQAALGKSLFPIQWHVHSMNPVGRKNIEKTMKRAEKFWELTAESLRSQGAEQ